MTIRAYPDAQHACHIHHMIAMTHGPIAASH